MNDRPIQVGDLVQVIKQIPCCGNYMAIGKIDKVISIFEQKAICAHCGKTELSIQANCESGYAFEIDRLKRIPPLSELESDKVKESEPIPC